MEKNIITKVGILTEQIRETYLSWHNTTSKVIKDRFGEKLKQQINEYERVTKGFRNCSKCREFLNDNKVTKYLGYSCSKDLEIYLYINICEHCGKINILDRERIGSCSGNCKPCSFHMDIKFPLNQNNYRKEDSNE